MTTDPLMLLHGWLRGCLPCDTSTAWKEIEIGRASVPEAYADFPRTAGELATALNALAIRGLVDDVGGEWFWRAGRVEREPQKELFA